MSKLHFFNFVLMLADHLEEDAFKICYIDTDSVLLSYTTKTLDEIVKQDKVCRKKNFIQGGITIKCFLLDYFYMIILRSNHGRKIKKSGLQKMTSVLKKLQVFFSIIFRKGL